MKTIQVYLSGTIQGVFFRKFLEEKAKELNIRGFCRNLEDGRVEVFLEGEVDNVNKMIELCKTGPKHSQIRKVEIKPEKVKQEVKPIKPKIEEKINPEIKPKVKEETKPEEAKKEVEAKPVIKKSISAKPKITPKVKPKIKTEPKVENKSKPKNSVSPILK